MLRTGVEAAPLLDTDVCIVGSGPAGMTVALELERRGVDCILLESGGRHVEAPRQALNATTQVGVSTDATDSNRIRALGGTSALWGGMCRRLDAEDFERRPWVPDSGWPIALGDLLPYYQRAHEILGLPPPDYELRKNDPLALSGPDFQNVVFFFDREPLRFGPRFGPHLEKSEKISLYLDATVQSIDTDDAGQRVTSVRVATLDQKRFQVRARRYVIAVGAIETARLLLSSDGTQKHGLGNQRDLVGRYFHQHAVFTVPRLFAFDFDARSRLRRESDRVYVTALRPETAREQGLLSFHVLLVGTGLAKAEARAAVLGRGLAAQARIWWQRRMHDYKQPHDDAAIGRYVGRLEHQLTAEKTRSDPELANFSDIEVRPEQAPNPDSRITLGTERDALGMRRAIMDWRLCRLDEDSLQRGLKLLARSVALNGIGRLKAKPDELVIPPFQRGYLHGGHHMYGTARMSESDQKGVVDANCRVHGVSNLYITGGAVFPTTGYANPTLSVVALAARMADHLATTPT